MKQTTHHYLTGVLAVLTIGMSVLWIWHLAKSTTEPVYTWDQLPAMSRSSLAQLKPGPEGDAQVQQHLLRLVYGTRAAVDWRSMQGPARVAWVAYNGHDKIAESGLDRYRGFLRLQPSLPTITEVEEMYRDIGAEPLAISFHEATLRNDPVAVSQLLQAQSVDFKQARCKYLNDHAKELSR